MCLCCYLTARRSMTQNLNVVTRTHVLTGEEEQQEEEEQEEDLFKANTVNLEVDSERGVRAVECRGLRT